MTIPPYHLTGKVKVFVFWERGSQPLPPPSAGRNPLLEQIPTPTLKETPVKSVFVLPGKRYVIPIEDRLWKCIPSVDEVSKKSLPISKRMMLLPRHSYRLHELDGAIPWTRLMHNFKGFENGTAGWIFEDWKTRLVNGSHKNE